MDIEYYKNYQGPNLIKATLNNEDITEKLRNIYGKENMVKITTGMGNYGNIKKFLETIVIIKKFIVNFIAKIKENIGSMDLLRI